MLHVEGLKPSTPVEQLHSRFAKKVKNGQWNEPPQNVNEFIPGPSPARNWTRDATIRPENFEGNPATF